MRYWILPVALLAIGCGQPTLEHAEEHGHEEGKVELSQDAQKLAGVETAPATYRLIQETLEAPGVVTSTGRGRAVVTPPVAGRVVSISVQLGQAVRQGQTLAMIESPELAQSWSAIAEAQRSRDAAIADLNQSRSEADLAKAKMNAAKASLVRQRDLIKAGAFSQAPLQQAQNELNDAQSELLSVQKEQVSHTVLVRRLENLYRDGIVSKSELEAARLELQQDQIRLDRARAKIDIAKATYDREKNIASRGLLNARELQTAEAEVRASQLEWQRAQIRVQSAQAALANSRRAIGNAEAVYRTNKGSGSGAVGRVALVAPMSGTVTRLDVTQGEAVDRAQVLLEVENLQSLWVTASVPESDSSRIRANTPVSIQVGAREYAGVVQIVGPKLDPKTRSNPVQCLVTGSEGLKPNMFATVRLGMGKQTRILVVPQTALVKEGKTTFVFVKGGDSFEKREVETGPTEDGVIAILDGLKENETVAVKGAFVLASEQKKDELKGHED